MLYWFRAAPDESGEVDFVPHMIDDDSGVGTQVVAYDVSGNGYPDIVVANKKGVFVFFNEPVEVSLEEWERAQPAPLEVNANADESGQGHVRDTEALTPDEQRRRFRLPPGFEIEVFAAEPDIGKPINIAFDGNGRLWVTQSSEYPYAAEPGRGADRITILETRTATAVPTRSRSSRTTSTSRSASIPFRAARSGSASRASFGSPMSTAT